jgi:hypothetical protein
MLKMDARVFISNWKKQGREQDSGERERVCVCERQSIGGREG